MKFPKKNKWPSKKQWGQILKILNRKEKIALFVFLGLFLSSALFLIINGYLKKTEARPALGGKYIEGMVGSPRFINPLYSQSSDVDRDLVAIIFSGLTKYTDSGEIVPDLAKEIRVEDEGRIYEVSLKENIFWHDGEKVKADDVIFTLQTIQNPDYKSPLRGNYLGIEIEKVSDGLMRFKLKAPYAAFLERLTFKILPQHIWQNISPQNFLLTNYNLKPIGSGPYQFEKIKQDDLGAIVALEVVRFKNYFDAQAKKPYLSQITFQFFESEEALVQAAKRGKIDAFALTSPAYFDFFKKSNFKEYSLSLPRYFGLFFNLNKSRLLADKNIREALNYATNKEELIEKVLLGRGRVVDSPVLPEIYGFLAPEKIYQYDPEKAEGLLGQAGFERKEEKWLKIDKEKIVEFKSDLQLASRGEEVKALQTCLSRDAAVYPEAKVTGYFGSQTRIAVIRFQEKYADEILKPWGFSQGTGRVSKTTRAKLNVICSKPVKETELKFTMVTVEDPLLKEVSLQLKNQWEKLGIKITIEAYAISQLEKELIKPRDYEILLFGEVLGAIPDPFPFWHSSQVKDPGLNLAGYENKTVDKLLESARISLDKEVRAQKYQKFQDALIEDAPSLFLYRPDFVYFLTQDIKGMETKMIVDPSKRFTNIENWYIKTKRVWK